MAQYSWREGGHDTLIIRESTESDLLQEAFNFQMA